LVSEYIFKLIRWGTASVFLVLMVCQWLLLLAARRPKISWRHQCATALLFLGSYATLFVIANGIDPLNRILTTRGVARVGVIRGYLGSWFAELYYLTDDKILQRAIARQKAPHDKLIPIEGDLPIGDRIVVIQCESLDFRLLDRKANGVVLTPFLNEL